MPLWKLDNGIPVGKIIKPHSYLGLVKVAFFMSGLDEYLGEGDFIFIEWMEKPVPYLIEDIHWEDDKTARVKLADVDTEEKAKKLKGRQLILPENEIPEELLEQMDEGDLNGYEVHDKKEGHIGQVTAIIESGPQSLLEVLQRGRTFLIPIHEDIIKKVDHKKKLISVDLPEGLIDL
jgi:16S rRNA processing protein RimM